MNLSHGPVETKRWEKCSPCLARDYISFLKENFKRNFYFKIKFFERKFPNGMGRQNFGGQLATLVTGTNEQFKN